jgi:hypothetical protein
VKHLPHLSHFESFFHLPHLSHFESFFHHPRRVDLASIFPNAKEVTESFGAFHAVIWHRLAARDDGDVTVMVVGDGVRPQA